jgi:hypothetical protein
MTINVKAIELPKVERPSMCDISHDLLSRAEIACELSDRVHENIVALEQALGIKISAGLDHLFYQIHEVLDSAQLVARTHDQFGWVLSDEANQ